MVAATESIDSGRQRPRLIAGAVIVAAAMSVLLVLGVVLFGWFRSNHLSLTDVLAQVSRDAADEHARDGYPVVSFVHIAELPEGEHWRDSQRLAIGTLLLQPEDLAGLGIDAAAATYAISVAPKDGTLTSFVSEGQDAAAVRKAARELGYTGDDRDLAAVEVPPDFTWAAQQLRIDGSSVLLGGRDADLELVSGRSFPVDRQLAGVWNSREVAECLGEPVAGQLVSDPRVQSVLGIGAVPTEDGRSEITVCALGDRARGEGFAAQMERSGDYVNVRIEVDGRYVRLLATPAPGVTAAQAIHILPTTIRRPGH